MIFSKQNLSIVQITKTDKAITALDNLHLCSDGSTVATNGTAVVAVSPVEERMSKNSVLDSTKMEFPETITAESAKEILRYIPRDTKFGGVLEHVDYAKGEFKFHDGKRGKSIEARTYDREYVNYKAVFERAFKQPTEIKTAVNLKRLIAVLQCVDSVCSDSSGNTPVYLQFTKDADVIIRCENRKTKQRIIGIFKAYSGVESQWLALSAWEQTLCGVRRAVARINKVKRKFKRTGSLRDVNSRLKEKSLKEKQQREEAFKSIRKNIHKKKGSSK